MVALGFVGNSLRRAKDNKTKKKKKTADPPRD